MPVFTLPYDHGNATVLTDTCIVMSTDGMYGDAVSYINGRMEFVTPHEFKAINWNRIVSARYDTTSGYPRIIARVSVYGSDLSERAKGVVRVIMRKIEPTRHAHVRSFFQARIPWLAYFEDFKERRTAVAMANHRRLGNGSALNQIGNDALAVVARFM